MSEPKWTKGPWRADGEVRLVSGDYLWCGEVVPDDAETDPFRGRICSIQSAEHIDGIRAAEAEANAHLIAAAPDLYEALKAFADMGKSYGWDNARTGRQLIMSDARAALSKARGE